MAGHTALARRFGVSEEKLQAVAEFHESPLFDDLEKAALRLAESVTWLGGNVNDEVWAEAERQFDQGELIELISVIGAFNSFNRMSNALRVEITR